VRTHSAVRVRHTAAGTRYAAVYPGLPAGDYVVWGRDGVPAGQVTVRGGQASRFSWPDPAAVSTGSHHHPELSQAVPAAVIPRLGPRDHCGFFMLGLSPGSRRRSAGRTRTR
jgi:hypothetical protein